LNIPWEIYPLFFVVAFFYSSVGHGGASGYLAVFALLGVTSPSIAPIALVLNILVASTSFWRYHAAGHFSFSVLLPFITLSVPAAFVGGSLHLAQHVFTLVLGFALILSAFRILVKRRGEELLQEPSRAILWKGGLPIGATLGLLSGMTGIGGGVFLSPLLILTRWATVKRSAALASAFIVVNSIGGLVGQLTRASLDLSIVLPLALTVMLGGAAGSYAGASRLSARVLQGILSIVLLSAGTKLVLQGL
jgi:uncharacterized membrane protein YfcA